MFPLDCIGEIIKFVSAPKIINTFLLVSKDIKQYIENENPECCGGGKFCLIKGITLPKNYVYNMLIPGHVIYISKSFCTMFKNITTIILYSKNDLFTLSDVMSQGKNFRYYASGTCAPKNLRTLIAINYWIDNDYLKLLTDITCFQMKYTTVGPQQIIYGKDILKMNKLKCLKSTCLIIEHESELIDKKDLLCLKIHRIMYNVSEVMFKNMINLRILIIYKGNPTITKKTFQYLQNLKMLIAYNVTSITDNDLRYVGKKVEILEIPNCVHITDKGLDYLKDHRSIYVRLTNNTNVTKQKLDELYHNKANI